MINSIIRKAGMDSVLPPQVCICGGKSIPEISGTGFVLRCTRCGKFVQTGFEKQYKKKKISVESVLESVFCRFDKAVDRIARFFAWLPKRIGKSMLRFHKNCIRVEDELTGLERINKAIDDENNRRIITEV